MRGKAARDIVRAVRYGATDAADVADHLYQHKLDVYIGTLEELAAQHGYELDADIVLSDEIDQALYDEAQLAASQIVTTYNRDLETFVATLPDDATPQQALDAVQAWQNERAAYKANVIGVDQAYSAHADATLHFYEAAGVAPTFDFGGHGDPAPECELCQALKDRNPHPLERVLEVGSPHPQCAQEWHAHIADGELPDEFQLGAGAPAGLLGRETFLQRHGNQRDRATRVIAGLA